MKLCQNGTTQPAYEVTIYCSRDANAPPTRGWPAGLRFDGDDYVRTALRKNSSMPITIELSVMMLSPSGTVLGNFEYSGMGLENVDEHWAFTSRDQSGYKSAVSQEPLKLRRKVLLAGTFDTEGIQLFVDGKLQSRERIDHHQASDLPFFIGADPGASGGPEYYFDGIIQSVRISDIVRYTEDYDATVPYTVDDSTLLMLDFTRPENELAKDMSKYNVPCEIVGATPVVAD